MHAVRHTRFLGRRKSVRLAQHARMYRVGRTSCAKMDSGSRLKNALTKEASC